LSGPCSRNCPDPLRRSGASLAEDDVDLGRVGLTREPQSEQNDVEHVADLDDLRALVPVANVLGDERVETEDPGYFRQGLGRG
jgi:hypothetical protein